MSAPNASVLLERHHRSGGARDGIKYRVVFSVSKLQHHVIVLHTFLAIRRIQTYNNPKPAESLLSYPSYFTLESFACFHIVSAKNTQMFKTLLKQVDSSYAMFGKA